MLLTRTLTILTLLLICWQDVKNRSVYWWAFPLLIISLILSFELQYHSFHEIFRPALINFGFLLFQFLLVSAYFSIKNKHWVNLTTGMLGWGDLLFLISIGAYLSVLNFLFFYIVSLIMVLLFWGIGQSFFLVKSKEVPLAGLQALLLILFLSGDWWLKIIDLTDDTWLLNLITK